MNRDSNNIRKTKRNIQELFDLKDNTNTNPFAKPSSTKSTVKAPSPSHLDMKAPSKVTYITVNTLEKELHNNFKHNSLFNNFYITGGLSGLNKYRWAWYFILDDPKHAKVSMSGEIPRCVFSKLPFKLQNGTDVDIVASLTVSKKYGKAQIKVKKIMLAGISELYLKAQKTKHELAKAGYFNQDHKKPIPRIPQRIAVITSQEGAVIRDIIDVTRARFPIAQIVLFPTAVSGSKAPSEMIRQIHHVDEVGNFDVAIIGRGGGSKKDLQTFNDKGLALAIYHCKTPIISSVGHGIDNEFISNYVADVHQDTPTAAADCATPIRLDDIKQSLAQWQQSLDSVVHRTFIDATQQLSVLENSVIYKHPERIYQPYSQDLKILKDKLNNSLQREIDTRSNVLNKINDKLSQNNPNDIIDRNEDKVNLLNQKLHDALQNQVQNHRTDLLQLTDGFKNINFNQIADNKLVEVKSLQQDLINSLRNIQQKQINSINQNATILKQLSPKRTMKRGYSFVTKGKHVIKDVKNIKPHDNVKIHFYKGSATVNVKHRSKKE